MSNLCHSSLKMCKDFKFRISISISFALKARQMNKLSICFHYKYWICVSLTVIYQRTRRYTSRHRIQVISGKSCFPFNILLSVFVLKRSLFLSNDLPSFTLSVSVRSDLEPGRREEKRERESPERVTFPACRVSHTTSLCFTGLFPLVFTSPSTMKKHTAARRGEEGHNTMGRTERDDTHHRNSQRKQRRWPSLLSEGWKRKTDAYEHQICAFRAARPVLLIQSHQSSTAKQETDVHLGYG